MPSVGDQFAAVFGAPVPFALAVVVLAIVIWSTIAWLYKWRYGGTIEHLEAMLRFVAEERRTASDRENNLASTVNSLTAELAKSKAKIEDRVARQLENSTAKLASDFAQLRQANSAIDEALRRGAAGTTMGISLFTGQQAEVPQWGIFQTRIGEPTVRAAEKPNVTSRSE